MVNLTIIITILTLQFLQIAKLNRKKILQDREKGMRVCIKSHGMTLQCTEYFSVFFRVFPWQNRNIDIESDLIIALFDFIEL